MAGLFGFFSSSTNTQVYMDEVPVTKEQDNSDGLTGVSKYLQNQKPSPNATGVAKYLRVKQQHLPSGVAKYVARKSIADKQKSQNEIVVLITGVDKYLRSQANKPQVKISSVAKYLANKEQNLNSSVAKYIARRNIALKNAAPLPKVTGVTKYLENRTEILATGVSKYLTQKSIVAKQLIAETAEVIESISVTEPLTGVEKYLQAKG